MAIEKLFFQNKHILVTGHTGFKGGWLSLWLSKLGARVYGYSLDPIKERPSFFKVAKVKDVLLGDVRADLADREKLKQVIQEIKPTIIFHLAAQPLVRESYRDPLYTFYTNSIGTANLLDAARYVDSIKAIVIITTDKVYANLERQQPYSEDDALGGHDPYSASKAMAEIVTASYRSSFFSGSNQQNPFIATARAGNVIGGGDWSSDRLVPDCLQAFYKKKKVTLRYPQSLRPWQHVLEPLSGYLKLAEKLCSANAHVFEKGWNFGPDEKDDATVREVANKIAALFSLNEDYIVTNEMEHFHEANILKLDSSMAKNELAWHPQWSLDTSLGLTVDWYKAWKKREDMQAYSLNQILRYDI
jgi:CDP-glucose 4,6-dehydratase